MKKKSKIRWVVFLTIVLTVAYCLVKCNYDKQWNVYEVAEGSSDIDNIRRLGRTWIEKDVIWFDYTMSGIEFILDAEECQISFISDMPDEENKHAIVGVFLDGNEEELERIEINEKNKVYVLKNTSNSQVTVKVVKLSEAKRGTVGIENIQVRGGEACIKATEEKELLFEFVGDSITCGMGNEGVWGEDFSTQTENGNRTFAAITSRYFDADLSCVCYSGIGMIRREEENYTFCVPEMYQYGRLLPEWLGVREDCLWEAKREPDVIVINIGTNDAPLLNNEKENEVKEKFQAVYQYFLDELFEKYPDVYIVCCVGPMNYEYQDLIQEIVTQREEKRLYFLEFERELIEGSGVSGHPTIATHQNMANKLIEFIEEKGIIEDK